MSKVVIAPYFFSRRKRVFDIVTSSLLLILLSPLFVIISVLIVVTSGWPILFVQNRVGKDKKVFRMIKFRTMYIDAHKDQKKYWKQNESPFPAFKLTNDPRFVGIGKWLSRTGLDELPQLINIVKGEMSLVGPRPLPISEAKKMTGSWNFRYRVKPGVVSLWALSGKRHKSLRDWKRLEVETVQKGTLFQNLKLLFQISKIIL